MCSKSSQPLSSLRKANTSQQLVQKRPFRASRHVLGEVGVFAEASRGSGRVLYLDRKVICDPLSHLGPRRCGL